MKTDFQTVRVENRDGTVVFLMDNPPVNQLSRPFLKELIEAITEAFGDRDVKGIVLIGTGKNFIAGADLTEIRQVTTPDAALVRSGMMATLLNAVEMGPKPVIAAINGNALGGGLELAMACHYRAAWKGAQLGQPEVKVGLIPGAGGTQRLPRLVRLKSALEMLTTGNPIDAHKALAEKLVDEVTDLEELLPTALRAVEKFTSSTISLDSRRTRNRLHHLPDVDELKAAVEEAKSTALTKWKEYPAHFKVIEAVELGLTLDIEADFLRERQLACDCALSDVAKNLIDLFLNTRRAGRLPRIENIKPAEVKKVAVLGGGVMGSGIVHLLLNKRFDTVLWARNQDSSARGISAVRRTFEYSVKKKTMTESDLEALLKDRLNTTTSLDDLKDVDLVIETVCEDMDVKLDLLRKLDNICRPETIFATNTSSLSVTEMASVLKDPGRMIGWHFFNPAHRMRLLEIACTKHTSDQTLASSTAFARSIHKIPFVVNDSPGFYVARQLGGLLGGFVYLVGGGVDLLRIETAMKNFGMPMGPAALVDLTGIDINYYARKSYEKALGDRYKVHPLVELVYQTGCYGRKTGSGYFDYTGDRPVPNKRVADVIQTYLKDNAIAPKHLSDQEITDAMLALAVNEAAMMMEEGVCDRPQDMDLAMVYGAGFPDYRGGVLRYADKWGIRQVYDTLVELEPQYGPRFKPAELLRDMADTGRTFYR